MISIRHEINGLLDIPTHFVTTDVSRVLPVVHCSVPEVCVEAIAITTQMDRISRTRRRAFAGQTEDTVVVSDVGNVTAILCS